MNRIRIRKSREVLSFWILVSVSFTLTAATPGFSQGHKQVEEGNRLFSEEKYDEANNKYRDALLDQPELEDIHFNIGDVQYKKRNYEEALKSYQKSISSDDILLQSQSYYNMGNTLYKMGKLPESILHFRKALELNPDDEDAKYNLEYVRAKLKDDQGDQKDQNDQQQNQDKQQEQNKQDQADQEDQKDGDQKEQDQQQDPEEEQDQQQENQERSNEEQKQDEQQEGQQGEEPKEISREDAERILDALQNDEEDLLKNKKKKKIRAAFRGKDW